MSSPVTSKRPTLVTRLVWRVGGGDDIRRNDCSFLKLTKDVPPRSTVRLEVCERVSRVEYVEGPNDRV